jgi:glycosyltransferase involved in cell wall biosynthesis
MKDSLLLIMTPNMSLEKWEALGQLSRELDVYQDLCSSANWKLLIFSYGRNDNKYVEQYPDIEVLNMPAWIPAKMPFRLQNFIYHIVAPICYRKFFKRVIFSKTNQFDAAPFGLFLKLLLAIPLVIRMGYYHSHFKAISSGKRLMELICFSNCNKIIVTSEEAGKFIASRYTIAPEKILCIQNSINLSLFKPQDAIKKYDIVFVGRLEKVKNIDLLLKVIEKLNLKALIIGDGSLRQQVIKLTERNTNVVWERRVNNIDLPLYYSQARAFVLLSRYEGNPKALLEAMACGIACLGTNVPGIRDCITHNYNGVLVEENVSSLISGLVFLLSNPYRAHLLGNNALKWVHAHCAATSNIMKELSFYEELSKGRYSTSLR